MELINVPHRAQGLLQEFFVNGPEKPTTEQEGPPLQQGALSRVAQLRYESPALARRGLRRLEEAMPGGGETSRVAAAAGPLRATEQAVR